MAANCYNFGYFAYAQILTRVRTMASVIVWPDTRILQRQKKLGHQISLALQSLQWLLVPNKPIVWILP